MGINSGLKGLKYAVTKPLHKNGNRFSMSNYRPISLLTTF